MKKILLVISIMLLLSSTVVCAADIEIDYDIDFDNSVIEIHCTTEAKYNQALSIILYQGTEMGNDLSKVVRIADIDADENGDADLEFSVKELPTNDYIISVSGGGSINNSGSQVIRFVNKNDLPGIIANINVATQDNIDVILGQYSEIFTLPSDIGVYKQFLSFRKEDYENTFTSVNDIKKGLELSQLFYDLNALNTETDILNYLKGNAEELSINVDDADFKATEEKFATCFIKLKKANPLTGNNSFVKMWNGALAISTINSCNAQSMTSAIIKYGNVIGISNSDYEANCAKFGDIEINKAFRDKGFESCQEILDAYDRRIKELSAPQGNNGGGDRGYSSNKGSSVVVSTPGVVQVNPVVSTIKVVDFTDLSEAEWARASIEKLAAAGVINGYSDNTFKPNKAVTREEFVKIVISAFNMYNADAKAEFTDVKETDWCYPYIASATEKELVSGMGNGIFGVGSNISRQDGATILYRLCKKIGMYFNDNEIDFIDSEEISEYAKEAVGALNRAGIINGFEDKSFRAYDPLTRAQAVKMIEIILNL